MTPTNQDMNCGAKTRSGKPCKTRGMKNGRCRMHGGKATGPPRGNTNSLKHGFYSNRVLPGERALLERASLITTLDDEICVMRVQLHRLVEQSGSAELAQLVGSAIDVTTKRGDEFDRALHTVAPYDRLEIKVTAPLYADLIIRTIDSIRKLLLAKFVMDGRDGNHLAATFDADEPREPTRP